MPGGRGHMRSFRFDDPIPTPQFGQIGLQPSPKVQQEWDFDRTANTMRYYPSLRCAAPNVDWGTTVKDNTLWDGSVGDWEVHHSDTENPNLSRLWREQYVQSFPRKRWLFWYDARGMYSTNLAYAGRVDFVDPLDVNGNKLYEEPNFLFQAFRYFPNPEYTATHYTYVEVILRQVAEVGYAMEWSVGIPGPSADPDKRELYLNARMGEESTAEWYVAQRWQCKPPEADSNGVMYEQLFFETIDGCFVLTLNGETFVYKVPPEEMPDVTTTVYGEPYQFTMLQRRPPRGGVD